MRDRKEKLSTRTLDWMSGWMEVLKKERERKFWNENQLRKEDDGAFLDIVNLR